MHNNRALNLAACLQVELGWLLDDAIESIKGAAGRRLNSRKIQQVLTLDTGMEEDVTVRMRVDISSLDCLWQQRIRERCHPSLQSSCAACMCSMLDPGPYEEGMLTQCQTAHAECPCNTSQGLRIGGIWSLQ